MNRSIRHHHWWDRVPTWLAIAACVLVSIIAPAPAGATTNSDPGRLPQTTGEPAFDGALNSQMTTLWRAIVRDDNALGRSVFFPRSAYLKMKTGLLPDPRNDYATRLIGFFDLDLIAYDRAVQAHGVPSLVHVSFNRAYATWIAPGHCENRIGYWHLPGVRLVFRSGVRLWSVAVDSLISWRGVWYVVHLGPNPRPTSAGTVLGFQAGAGTPGPPGGC